MTSTLSLETKFWKTKSTEVLQGNLAMGRDALVKIFIKKKKSFFSVNYLTIINVFVLLSHRIL